jgi:hypothetical protein
MSKTLLTSVMFDVSPKELVDGEKRQDPGTTIRDRDSTCPLLYVTFCDVVPVLDHYVACFGVLGLRPDFV